MSSDTSTASRLVEHGAPLQVQEVVLPEPGPDEVRVELAYGGVNPIDRYVAAGLVAPDAPLPRTLGSEATGRSGGRPVLVAGAGMGTARDGVWASEAVVPSSAVLPLPDGVSLEAAAAMGIAGLTAWQVLELVQLTADDRVLVLGASGGVGHLVVSLAAAAGAQVCGQTGDEGKAEFLRGQGADQVVVVPDAAGLAEAVGDLRPTVVVDPLGGAYTDAALAVLEPRGRLGLFGTSAGPRAEVHLQGLYRKAATVYGFSALQLTPTERTDGLNAALQALADGRMRVVVDHVLPLAEVAEAFRLLVDRELTGKVLLDLR